MSSEPSASLAFGIDFGEEGPDFLEGFDGDLHEWVGSDAGRSEIFEVVTYFWSDHEILALKGHAHHAHYGSLTTEIRSLDVDEDRLRLFKAELEAAGHSDPQPRWLLTFDNC